MMRNELQVGTYEAFLARGMHYLGTASRQGDNLAFTLSDFHWSEHVK
jgi:hypothetical protein